MPFAFKLAPTQTLRAECRFLPEAARADFELYVSPLNIDPMAPALPISSPAATPPSSRARPAASTRQGMPEDTKGLKTGVLTPAEFLATGANRRREKSGGSMRTCSIGFTTASCSTTSAMSIRCRT